MNNFHEMNVLECNFLNSEKKTKKKNPFFPFNGDQSLKDNKINKMNEKNNVTLMKFFCISFRAYADNELNNG